MGPLRFFQPTQIDKLFQLLHLIVHTVTPSMGLTRMLMSKNVNNNVVKDLCILFQNMRIYNASNKKRE